MKSLGIIGCGNIGEEILRYKFKNVQRYFLYDIDRQRLLEVKNKYKNLKIFLCESVKNVIDCSDIIVESASINAVKDVLEGIKGFPDKHLLILSVGGILQNFALYKSLKTKNYNIHIPSGAIAGCDGISALSLSKIKKIVLRTTKPVESLIDSPYVKLHKKVYNKILNSEKTTIFKGNVYNAIKFFPQNINVAATLAIFSENPSKIQVEIVAEKNIKRNVHEITVISSAGKIYTKVENIPSISNPKTSYLTILSVIHKLKTLLGES